ncbi:LuxR C-terminal-related transcriptional regulator [Stappia sp.]|uniref:helix-turn-helix transcriptional regulator n=1 Tax=Stappia sp. TaxID=1870903 RepID=UPI0032D93CAD
MILHPSSSVAAPGLALLFQVLDKRGSSAFLLDRQATILARNEAAQRLLEGACGLLVPTGRRGNRLEFAHPLTQRTLTAALAALLRPTGPDPTQQSDLCLTCDDGPMLGELYPVLLPDPGPAGPRGAVLVLSRGNAPPPTLEPRLRLLFNLTPRESAVAVHLASALPETEIARDLDISENTLRTHRKAIYAKLGVNSRAEFSAIVARLM